MLCKEEPEAADIAGKATEPYLSRVPLVVIIHLARGRGGQAKCVTDNLLILVKYCNKAIKKGSCRLYYIQQQYAHIPAIEFNGMKRELIMMLPHIRLVCLKRNMKNINPLRARWGKSLKKPPSSSLPLPL